MAPRRAAPCRGTSPPSLPGPALTLPTLLSLQGVHLPPVLQRLLITQFAIDGDGLIRYNDFLVFFHDDLAPAPSAAAAAGGADVPANAPELERQLRAKLRRLVTGPSLRRQFQQFDKDRSGAISLQELTRMLSRLGACRCAPALPRRLSLRPAAGVDATEAETRWLGRRLDRDGDGRIQLDEFEAFVADRAAAEGDIAAEQVRGSCAVRCPGARSSRAGGSAAALCCHQEPR